MATSDLLPPVTYQGGKQRLAAQIIDAMEVPPTHHFLELCCGSGAVSLALIQGGHPPSQVTMVDRGPWGLFWEQVGSGTFNMGGFRALCEGFPVDPKRIKPIIEDLYRQPVGSDPVPTFLLLQATAIGGAAIWIENGVWRRSSGFRDYWVPTETSNRRSPVNPMMPMPDTILARVGRIVKACQGLRGRCGDATGMVAGVDTVAYIDPPYDNTTSYPYTLDFVRLAQNIGCPCWVSEGRALTGHALLLSGGRKKGGITGDRVRGANSEWLSYFNPAGGAVSAPASVLDLF